MSIVDKIKMFFWIAALLKQRGPISLSDINEEWMQFHDSDKMPFERNTFRHHLRSVEELFNIDIDYCHGGYFIVDPAPLRERNWQNIMLSDIANIDFLSHFRTLGSRIQTEDIPAGNQYLQTIGMSLSKCYRLKIVYQKYNDVESNSLLIEPYCLKAVKRRWYILACKIDDTKLKVYALDRIRDVELSKEHFELDPSIDVGAYFRNSFGIVVDNALVDTVRIRTSESTAPYLRALPLHSSQREEPLCQFNYHIAVTTDFKNELFRYGDEIEVLEPLSLRAEFRERIERMRNLYSE